MGRKREKDFHLPVNMRFKHGAYYYDHGKRKSRVGKTYEFLSKDYKEAKLKWAQINADGEEPDSGTFAEMATFYQAEALPSKAKNTQDLHNMCIRFLLKSFGDAMLADIEPHHIYGYLDANPSKVSANRQISVMSNIFQLAIRKGYVSLNPCRQVTRNPEKPRDRYIEDFEYQAVKSLALPVVRSVMDFAYMTAMRRGDILALRLDQIEDQGIRVIQEKTKKRQIIEWSPALKECVNKLKSMEPALRPTLVCTRKGRPYTDDGFAAIWQRLMKNAVTELGITRFTFHDIRAKSLTDAETQGLDPQKLAGHTTAKQTQTYLRSKTIDRIQPVKMDSGHTPKILDTKRDAKS